MLLHFTAIIVYIVETNPVSMDTNNSTQPTETAGLFDLEQDTLREIQEIETKKTRKRLLILAAVIFGADLLGMIRADMLDVDTLILCLVVPAIMVGLAFLAMKEPVTAVVIAILVLAATFTLAAVQFGARALISGFLVKAIIISLLISAYQSANEARKTKRQLEGFA